jgi:hypothetical protein
MCSSEADNGGPEFEPEFGPEFGVLILQSSTPIPFREVTSQYL